MLPHTRPHCGLKFTTRVVVERRMSPLTQGQGIQGFQLLLSTHEFLLQLEKFWKGQNQLIWLGIFHSVRCLRTSHPGGLWVAYNHYEDIPILQFKI